VRRPAPGVRCRHDLAGPAPPHGNGAPATGPSRAMSDWMRRCRAAARPAGHRGAAPRRPARASAAHPRAPGGCVPGAASQAAGAVARHARHRSGRGHRPAAAADSGRPRPGPGPQRRARAVARCRSAVSGSPARAAGAPRPSRLLAHARAHPARPGPRWRVHRSRPPAPAWRRPGAPDPPAQRPPMPAASGVPPPPGKPARPRLARTSERVGGRAVRRPAHGS
jgi:hypothetical protein